MEATEWITAAGTAAVPIGVVVAAYFRPIFRRLDDQNEEMKKQRADIEALRADAAARGDLRDLQNAMASHERTDQERFDDLGEKFESRLGGLRKEMVDGHVSAIRQIKVDQDTAMSVIRDDLRALGKEVRERFDGLMAMMAGGGRRGQNAPGDD